MIASYIASKLFAPIAGGVALVLVLVLGWQTLQLNGVRSDLKEARAELAAKTAEYDRCVVNRTGLEASIKARNAEIEHQRAESDRKAKDLAKARQKAETEAQRADQAASKLASFKPTGADTCARLLAVDEAVRGAL